MVFMRRYKSGAGAVGQDRPGLNEDQVREMIHFDVVFVVQVQIPKFFRSIKTSIMEFFDD